MNEGNPGLDMGSDAVENLEGAFRRLREMMLGECEDGHWDPKVRAFADGGLPAFVPFIIEPQPVGNTYA